MFSKCSLILSVLLVGAVSCGVEIGSGEDGPERPKGFDERNVFGKIDGADFMLKSGYAVQSQFDSGRYTVVLSSSPIPNICDSFVLRNDEFSLSTVEHENLDFLAFNANHSYYSNDPSDSQQGKFKVVGRDSFSETGYDEGRYFVKQDGPNLSGFMKFYSSESSFLNGSFKVPVCGKSNPPKKPRQAPLAGKFHSSTFVAKTAFAEPESDWILDENSVNDAENESPTGLKKYKITISEFELNDPCKEIPTGEYRQIQFSAELDLTKNENVISSSSVVLGINKGPEYVDLQNVKAKFKFEKNEKDKNALKGRGIIHKDMQNSMDGEFKLLLCEG